MAHERSLGLLIINKSNKLTINKSKKPLMLTRCIGVYDTAKKVFIQVHKTLEVQKVHDKKPIHKPRN